MFKECSPIFHTILIAMIILDSFQASKSLGKQKQNIQNVPIFKRFSCDFSDELREMMYENSSCTLSKLSRRVSAINMYILLKEPVDIIIVSWM